MKLIKLNHLNLEKLEKLFLQIHNKLTQNKKFNLKFFSIYMHKKLNYYRFLWNNKFYIYTNGQLLKKNAKKIKFYKKSKKSFGYVINTLNKKIKKKLNSIEFFYCKNFNFKNYFWIKKLFTLIKPKINFFLITNSWNYIHKDRRRIKKKIFRNLFKSHNS